MLKLHMIYYLHTFLLCLMYSTQETYIYLIMCQHGELVCRLLCHKQSFVECFPGLQTFVREVYQISYMNSHPFAIVYMAHDKHPRKHVCDSVCVCECRDRERQRHREREGGQRGRQTDRVRDRVRDRDTQRDRHTEIDMKRQTH